MAIHVYMSKHKGHELAGDWQMNYRGEAGPNDDPHAFKRRMEAQGHVVTLVDERVAGEVTPAKRAGSPQLPANVPHSAFSLEA